VFGEVGEVLRQLDGGLAAGFGAAHEETDLRPLQGDFLQVEERVLARFDLRQQLLWSVVHALLAVLGANCST
jgi:hypothetical protein